MLESTENSSSLEGPSDPILKELLPEFLDAWQHDLTVQWKEIVQRNDLKELERFGHTIKGSFLQFGFRKFALIGKEIMEAASQSDWIRAERHVQQLVAAVHTIRSNSTS